MKQDYFRMFANCLVTQGHTRAIIADLQRQQSAFIPNSLAEIIERLNHRESISSLYAEYGSDNEEALQEYLSFLEEEEYGFYCDEQEFDLFPVMDTRFLIPCAISNIIIEARSTGLQLLGNIIAQAERLGCKDVALVFYEALTREHFLHIKEVFDNTIVKSVALISGYSEQHTEPSMQQFSMEFERLTALIFHTAPESKEISWDNRMLCDLTYTSQRYQNFSFCGGVHMEMFGTNQPKVLEALHHNSCLHKKIAVDLAGNIKNCPTMPKSFGNIASTTLEEALQHPDFMEYWPLTKDQVAVCKDCEFRYICTDCRAYTERNHSTPAGLDNAKPLKCGYDPYTGVWEEWSRNPLKQKAIAHYDMLSLVKR